MDKKERRAQAALGIIPEGTEMDVITKSSVAFIYKGGEWQFQYDMVVKQGACNTEYYHRVKWGEFDE